MRNACTDIGLWFWAIAIAFASPASSQATTVCAVIAAPGSSTASAAELLEAYLAEDQTFRLVSRQDIRAVLNEQALSEALSTSGLESRVRLGKLVNADLLVFLHESTSKDASGLLLTVAETKHGLRLAMEPTLWSADRAESICREMVPTVQRARAIADSPDLRIVAVSPFECRDVALDRNRNRQAYASLIEQYVTKQPGCVVIELAEAKALSQEIAISGQAMTRELPYYLFGSYKTVGTTDRPGVDVSLELRHGEQLLGRASRNSIEKDKTGETLETLTTELLPRMLDTGASAPPVKLETRLLLERGDLFAQIAEWDQAISLYESLLILDPKHERAHLQLIRSHLALMPDGRWDHSQKRMHGTYYAGRIQHAESVLDHVEALLFHEPPLETRSTRTLPPGEFTADQVHINDVFQALGQFCGQFWIDYPAKLKPGTEDLHPAFRRAAQRHADILLRALTERYRDSLTKSRPYGLVSAIRQAAVKQTRGEDDEGALRTMIRLLNLLDEAENESAMMYTVAHYLTGYVSEQHFQALLNRLEQSDSRRMLRAARIGSILQGIKDEDSLRDAQMEIRNLAQRDELRELLKSAETRLADVKRVEHKLDRQQTRRRSPGSQPSVTDISPQLKKLILSLHVSDRRGKAAVEILDWLVIAPDLELAATSAGVCRLGENNRLEPLWLSGKKWQGQLRWDGCYVWAMPVVSGPIVVIDPHSGKVAEFDATDMPAGVNLPRGELVTIKPGQACLFGYLHPENSVHRNFATLLSISSDPGGEMIKHSEVFFEARQTGRLAPPHSITARDPSWSQRLAPKKSGGRPMLLIGGQWGDPLVIDPEKKSVRELGHWPSNSSILPSGDGYWVGSGTVSASSQQSALYWTPDGISKPELLIDFGHRPFLGNVFGPGPYYVSMIVHENVLHLLADRIMFEDRSPAWVAVDLETRQTYCLAETLIGRLPRTWPQKLCISPHYGFLLLTGGELHRIELPPRSEWPIWHAPSKSKAKHTITARPIAETQP